MNYLNVQEIKYLLQSLPFRREKLTNGIFLSFNYTIKYKMKISKLIFCYFQIEKVTRTSQNVRFAPLAPTARNMAEKPLIGPCDPGYYCPGGQDVPRPTEYACSLGHFCLQGSWNETVCPAGTYQPQSKQSDCVNCTAGVLLQSFWWVVFLDISFPL